MMAAIDEREISEQARLRLKAFRQGLANNAIEGITLDERDRAYCEALVVNDSLTDNQRVEFMIAFIKANPLP